MRTFIYQHLNVVYVVEGITHEAAFMKFLKAIPKELHAEFEGAPKMEMLPKHLASTPEAREVCYGR
jgi:hypothetical protein